MKHLVIVVGIVVACAWGTTYSAQQKSPVFGFPYESMELSNGLRTYFSGQATPITYAGERSAEAIEEDEIIARWPLKVTDEDVTLMEIDRVLE